MPNLKFRRRFELFSFIKFFDALATIPYDRCQFRGVFCFVMKNHFKCFECIRLSRFCIDLFFDFIFNICDKFEFELYRILEKSEQIQFQLNILLIRVNRLRKIFQRHRRLQKKKNIVCRS